MNYRELCRNLLDHLYKVMADWLFSFENAEHSLVDDKNQRERELINDLQYQGHIWVGRLDNVRCDLDNSKTEDKIQGSKLLYKKLCDLVNEISSLEAIKNDQIEQERHDVQTLEDLKEQLSHEEKKVQNLKQLTTGNYKELSRLREEVGGKKDERDRLVSEIEKIRDKLKKQEKEIAAEGEYLKKLDEQISDIKGSIEKLEKKIDITQRQLESIKKQNIEKERILEKLRQEEIKEKKQLIALKDQVAVQYKSSILEIESDSDSEIEELTTIQSKVINQSNSINQLGSTLKSLQDELQNNISQNENLDEEDPMQSLQGSTISLTAQIEVSSKETQTLNMQYNRTMGYIVFFTIPFSLTGISLTVVPLVKSTENNTIFLSVGLSFSALAIVCLTAVALYNHYSEPAADLALPKKLSDNSINNTVIQDCNMSKT